LQKEFLLAASFLTSVLLPEVCCEAACTTWASRVLHNHNCPGTFSPGAQHFLPLCVFEAATKVLAEAFCFKRILKFPVKGLDKWSCDKAQGVQRAKLQKIQNHRNPHSGKNLSVACMIQPSD
jgi:hypothetical protein